MALADAVVASHTSVTAWLGPEETLSSGDYGSIARILRFWYEGSAGGRYPLGCRQGTTVTNR
jgi:hypothetical protein